MKRALSCLAAVLAACLVGPAAFASGGRIPIYQPTEITQPGAYYLARDIAAPSGTAAIVIRSSNVDLDLGGHVIQGGAGIQVRAGRGVTIRNGSVTGSTYGVHAYLTDRGPLVIEDLTVTECTAGIYVLGTEDDPVMTVVRRNVIAHCQEGIRVHRTRATLEHNTIGPTTAVAAALLVSWCQDCRVSENRVSDAAGTGIRLEVSFGFLLSGNAVSNTGDRGISIDSISTAGLVQENVATFADGPAIEVAGYGVRLVGNLASSSQQGLVCTGNNAVLDGNTALGNTAAGLVLTGSGSIYASNRVIGNGAPANVASHARDAGGNVIVHP